MVVAPAVVAAFLVGAIPAASIFGTGTNMATDNFPVHGYVTVSVLRDGQEIYHHEDHNLITTAGQDFIRQQIGETSSGNIGTNGANYIALSSNTATPAASDTTLTGEITTGGLARAQGTYAEVSTDQFTITKTFTASATHTSVQKAGLFTASSSGTMMAENTFTSVSLASGDQLTITWTITLS
jgi:hypothetical protein